MRQAAKLADLTHRYGDEKVENVSGVVEGALIFGAAIIIIYEAVQKLINGLHIDHLWLAIGSCSLSAAVNIGVSATSSHRSAHGERRRSRPTLPTS